MTGTKQGRDKMIATMIAKYGSEEAWKEVLRANLKKGRENPNRKVTGFGIMDKEAHIEASRKGGRNRGKQTK